MTFKTIPQFVPQEVCLSCEGCCRFNEPNSFWRPRVGMEEVSHLSVKQPSLAHRIFGTQMLDKKGQLKALLKEQKCECVHFNSSSNACSIYDQRPFECRLYPFLISRQDEQIYLSVHLSCPYILDYRETKEFTEFVEQLRGYFSDKHVQEFLSNDPHLIPEYTEYKNEIDNLFPICSINPSDPILSRRLDFQSHISNSLDISTQDFIHLFIWKDHINYEFEKNEYGLGIFADASAGTYLHCPPLGVKFNDHTADFWLNKLDEKPGPRGVKRIEQVTYHQQKNLSQEKFKISKTGFEMCYFREDIVDLKGNKYKSQRSSLNRFLKGHHADYLPYEHSMKNDCLRLLDSWSYKKSLSSSDDIFNHMLEENRMVHERCFVHFQSLGLVGRVVKINGSIEAYSFAYSKDPRVMCILLEVSNPEIKGLATYIFRQICSDETFKEHAFVNVMDSFHLPNVEKTKLSYRPTLKLPIYTVSNHVV